MPVLAERSILVAAQSRGKPRIIAKNQCVERLQKNGFTIRSGKLDNTHP
jgi:hypothetical protein